MNDRLTMRGALEEKKQERIKLATKAEALIRGLRTAIMPASVTPLEELKTAEILALAQDLHSLKSRYDFLITQIKELKKELGL